MLPLSGASSFGVAMRFIGGCCVGCGRGGCKFCCGGAFVVAVFLAGGCYGSRGIWGWLWFSGGVVHGGRGLWILDTFLMSPNFLRP